MILTIKATSVGEINFFESDFLFFEYGIRYNVKNAPPRSRTPIFEFSALDYIVWDHFRWYQFWAVPSPSQ